MRVRLLFLVKLHLFGLVYSCWERRSDTDFLNYALRAKNKIYCIFEAKEIPSLDP